jgi:ATP-dependent DNA ligase
MYDRAAVLCAFDLIELDGEDLRRSPIEHRKRALAVRREAEEDWDRRRKQPRAAGP